MFDQFKYRLQQAVRRILNPRREALMDELRAAARPLGVEWLRDTLRKYRVSRLSDISMEHLAAELQAIRCAA